MDVVLHAIDQVVPDEDGQAAMDAAMAIVEGLYAGVHDLEDQQPK
jgi:hypothetical protein